jgi:hypothetical protein
VVQGFAGLFPRTYLLQLLEIVYHNQKPPVNPVLARIANLPEILCELEVRGNNLAIDHVAQCLFEFLQLPRIHALNYTQKQNSFGDWGLLCQYNLRTSSSD